MPLGRGFVCLFVCLLAGVLKKLAMALGVGFGMKTSSAGTSRGALVHDCAMQNPSFSTYKLLLCSNFKVVQMCKKNCISSYTLAGKAATVSDGYRQVKHTHVVAYTPHTCRYCQHNQSWGYLLVLVSETFNFIDAFWCLSFLIIRRKLPAFLPHAM